MGCSAAQLAANRANAAQATGPRTAAGKERSRRNALKHGLTGAGIVLPTEDEAAIEARFAEFDADLQPQGGVARFLVRRAALLSVRLDRAALQEAAHLSARIIDLPSSEAEVEPADPEAEMDALFDRLLARPSTARDEVLAEPGGGDRLIAALGQFRNLLGAEGPIEWTATHADFLEALLGHDPASPPARSRLLGDVVLGDCSRLRAAETADLDPAGKRQWAADQLAHLIAAAIEQLRADHANPPPPARPKATNRALFDASPEATLARRYEASTERALFRTLKEIRELSIQPPPPEPVAAPDCADLPPELGSFRRAPGSTRPGLMFVPPTPPCAGPTRDPGRLAPPLTPDPAPTGPPPAD